MGRTEAESYTYEELDSLSQEEAIRGIRSVYKDVFYRDEVSRFRRSLEKFCDRYGIELVDMYIDLDGGSVINVDVSGLVSDSDETELDELLNVVRDDIDMVHRGNLILTGSYTDGYMYGHLERLDVFDNTDHLDSLNVISHLEYSVGEGLKEFVDEFRESLIDVRELRTFAKTNGLRFDTFGRVVKFD